MSIVTGLLSIFGIPRYRGTFCEETGHAEDKCFVKNRSELRNQRNVNLCAPKVVTNVDVVPAVVQIKTDVLIESGAQRNH